VKNLARNLTLEAQIETRSVPLRTGSLQSRSFFQMLRIHHWVKNFLVFIPLVVGHKLDLRYIGAAFLSFFAFSLSASAAYLINDIFDLEADRAHSIKKFRPLAAGEVSLVLVRFLASSLFLISLVVALLLPSEFRVLLLLYFFTTCLYSMVLKRIAVVDVLVLSSLYSLRVLAGGVAEHVHVSHWLMTFCLFLFFSLACVKRFAELLVAKNAEVTNLTRRGYLTLDLEQISQLGTASGFIAVLVLALYINSHEVTRLYRHPSNLLFICPILMYWVSRLWLLARRGAVLQDPIVFALTDFPSYFVALASMLLVFFSI